MIGIPERQIRAQFDARTIRVYQAYSAEIAGPAIEQQSFVSPPFKMDRMTWIERITDVTGVAREIKSLRDAGRRADALALLPREGPYPSDFI